MQRNSSRDLRIRFGKDWPFGTTAYGPYENSMFEFNHYAFGCVRATSTLVFVPHFDYRVNLLARPSLASPSSASSRSAFLPFEASPHAEGRRLRIRAACGSALPSPGPTSSLWCSSMRVQFLFWGGRTCFPDRGCWRLPESPCISHRSCLPVPRSLSLLGRPDVFSRSRLCIST